MYVSLILFLPSIWMAMMTNRKWQNESSVSWKQWWIARKNVFPWRHCEMRNYAILSLIKRVMLMRHILGLLLKWLPYLMRRRKISRKLSKLPVSSFMIRIRIYVLVLSYIWVLAITRIVTMRVVTSSHCHIWVKITGELLRLLTEMPSWGISRLGRLSRRFIFSFWQILSLQSTFGDIMLLIKQYNYNIFVMRNILECCLVSLHLRD